MKREEQRITIAEAFPQTIRLHKTFWQYRNGRNWIDCVNNDPLRDLNAMHEAEKMLTDDQLKTYDGWLIVLSDGPSSRRAAAAQRAESFLKTLNLWKQ